jgi:hypothetical protein
METLTIVAPNPKNKSQRVLKTDIPPLPNQAQSPQRSRPTSTMPLSGFSISTPGFIGDEPETLAEGQSTTVGKQGMPIGSTLASTPAPQ